jgi:HAD superfamily hydrolase (TIGR01662 family)
MYSKHRIKVVLFDLGSTLIFNDSDWEIVIPQCDQTMIACLRENGLNVDSGFIKKYNQYEDELFQKFNKELLEYPMTVILAEVLSLQGYPEVSPHVIRLAVDAFYSTAQSHWHPEDDAFSTIKLLKTEGYRLGMISNAGDENDVLALMEKVGVRDDFEQILVSSTLRIRKPSVQIFQRALDHFGIEPEEAVMVGDTLAADVLGANTAGIGSVWIKRRADRPDNRQLMGRIIPNLEIDRLSDLPNLLKSW